jgi:hypothetical protein
VSKGIVCKFILQLLFSIKQPVLEFFLLGSLYQISLNSPRLKEKVPECRNHFWGKKQDKCQD